MSKNTLPYSFFFSSSNKLEKIFIHNLSAGMTGLEFGAIFMIDYENFSSNFKRIFTFPYIGAERIWSDYELVSIAF